MRYLLAVLMLTLPLTGISAASGEVIEQRQAAFKEIKASMKTVKKNLKKDNTVVAAAAGTVLEKAEELQGLFPDDSFEGDTRAKKKILEKREDFEARQQNFSENAAALVEAAQGDDPKVLKKAFKEVSGDCKGCHMRYRKLL